MNGVVPQAALNIFNLCRFPKLNSHLSCRR